MISIVNRLAFGTILLLCITFPTRTLSFVTPPHALLNQRVSSTNDGMLMATPEFQQKEPNPIEQITAKYGLEAGLFQSLREDDGGTTAKELLTKYGVAYLATSIPLALLSFAICYGLVNNGVEVTGILSQIGIASNSGDTSEKVGTFAIAYAAHKAASPIRFPPTVLLTPVMAKLIGKDPNDEMK